MWDEETLQSKGFTLLPDGSWSKGVATNPRILNAEPQPDRLPEVAGKERGQEASGQSPGAKYQLTITRFGTRLLDEDNLAGGSKSLVDALRTAGLIPEDDPASVNIKWKQTKVTERARTGTTIEIERKA